MKDSDYMNLAITEAEKAAGMTWTNPLVGAVIVKDGQVLATGYHHQYGKVHAEIDALNNLSSKQLAQGATLYVTLEPCSHYGKQPPCVKRVVEAGIKRVVIGQIDPHQLVAGKGIAYLKKSDVQVEVIGGVSELYHAYNFYYRHKRPYVVMKYAMSLDGKINEAGKKRTILTKEPAQLDVQRLRCQQQAILIGANTLRIDNPQLTVRIKALPKPPIRIVLTRDVQKLTGQWNLLKTPGEVWFLSEKPARVKVFDKVKVFTAKKWTPEKIVQFLFEKGIQKLLVEGGSNLQAQFIASQLVDEIVTYLAAQILGGTALPAVFGQELKSKVPYKLRDVKQLGQDIRIRIRRT